MPQGCWDHLGKDRGAQETTDNSPPTRSLRGSKGQLQQLLGQVYWAQKKLEETKSENEKSLKEVKEQIEMLKKISKENDESLLKAVRDSMFTNSGNRIIFTIKI